MKSEMEKVIKLIYRFCHNNQIILIMVEKSANSILFSKGRNRNRNPGPRSPISVPVPARPPAPSSTCAPTQTCADIKNMQDDSLILWFVCCWSVLYALKLYSYSYFTPARALSLSAILALSAGIRWNANGVWYVATFGSFRVRNLINLRATSNDKVGVARLRNWTENWPKMKENRGQREIYQK